MRFSVLWAGYPWAVVLHVQMCAPDVASMITTNAAAAISLAVVMQQLLTLHPLDFPHLAPRIPTYSTAQEDTRAFQPDSTADM